MAVTPMSDDLNIIAELADRPNATDGLTAAQLKAKYDQGPGLLKTYINETLVPAIDAAQLGTVAGQSAINGNFLVNQRVKSGTVTLTAGAYGHDRWKAGASGCTYTFATSGNITTITITAGSLIQVIEGTSLFSGTYTLSWTGTAQGKIGSGSYGASGITGTAEGGTNLNIEFNTGTLSKVQFNAGTAALPFQPRSFAEELALCQRYYQRIDNEQSNSRLGVGLAKGTTLADIIVTLKQKMRVLPTLLASAASDLELSDGVTATLLTNVSLATNVSSSNIVVVTGQVASGLTQFRPYFLEFVSAGTKYLAFDSEL